jgi:hypothetical protein
LGSATAEVDAYNSVAADLREKNHKLYLAVCHHRSTRGRSMTFDNAHFLVPIYTALNTARELCVQKSVQCGVSEALIVSHLEEAARGLSIMYVLPKTELRNTFVQSRINRLIKRVPLYTQMLRQAAVTKADSVLLKHFGLGVIKYVGSNSESDFKEFPADALYIDEKDQCDPEILGLATDRLQSSEERLIRTVANPTVEDYGIDVDWKESSQGEWRIRCGKCRKWQKLDWFENVVAPLGDDRYESRDKRWRKDPLGNEHRLFCSKCGKELDRFAPGEYVHAFRKRRKLGFRINQIFGAIHIPLSEIVEAFFKAQHNAHLMQLFFNSRLGLPYSSKGNKITEEELRACIVEGYSLPKNYEGRAGMGVDVGKRLHVIIRGSIVTKGRPKFPLIFAGEVDNENDLLRLAQRHDVKYAVVDALPEERMVARAKALMSFMHSCFFNEAAKYPTLNREHKVLTVERAVSISRVHEAVMARQYVNPPEIGDVESYVDHMTHQVRVFDDKRGRFVWKKTGADHYLLAEAYCMLAMDMMASLNLFQFYEDESAAREQQKGKTQNEVLNELAEQLHGPKQTAEGAALGIQPGDTW